MRLSDYQKTLSWAVLALAVVLLYFGLQCYYEIYPQETPRSPEPQLVESPFGQPMIAELSVGAPSKAEPLPGQISDLELVANATFAGVVRRDGNLYWTYDPAKKQGKQPCPT